MTKPQYQVVLNGRLADPSFAQTVWAHLAKVTKPPSQQVIEVMSRIASRSKVWR